MFIKKTYCVLLCLLISIGTSYLKGFSSDTLIKTASGHHNIQQLNINDNVLSSNNGILQQFPIINKQYYTADYYIRIRIDNECINTTLEQQFYLYNDNKWVTAHKLKSTDLLMNSEGLPIQINSIEIVNLPCIIHQISIKTNHTYCVSSYNIIVHNSPIIALSLHTIPQIIPVIAQIAHTGLTIGVTLLGINCIQKIFGKNKHKQRHITNNSSNAYGSFNGGGWNDPDNNENDDDHNQKHPHGLYENSPYHHRNSRGTKSPCPKNGQRCLDYSLPTEGTQRIAIENDTFVLLKYTSPGKYHGHVVTWKELHNKLQTILIKNGFVTTSGRILKQITEKALK